MATAAKTSRKKSNKRPGGKTQKKPNAARSEVKYIVLAALGILISLSVYIQGSVGFVGIFLASFFTGLFGFGAYILPLAIIAAAAYGLFSRGKAIPSVLIIQVILLFWIVIAFMHILTVPDQEGFGLWAYLQLLYSQGAGSNGGLFGGLLGNMLRRFLGVVGAYIVLVLGALVILLLLTGRSFAQGLTGAWEYARDHLHYEDDEDYDDDEDDDDFDEEFVNPPRELKPLPERLIKRKVKQKGNILDIREAVQQRDEKILLFHEEIDQGFPVKNKVLPFKASSPRKPGQETAFTEDEPSFKGLPPDMEETSPGTGKIIVDITNDYAIDDEDADITVKGLVSPEGSDYKSSYRMEQSTNPGTASHEVKPRDTGAGFDLSPRYEDYRFPPLDLLTRPLTVNNSSESRTQILENSRILEETLRSFKVEAKVVEVSVGPTVTRYDLAPGAGVKVATIANLSNDLALSLAAQGIRIEAPIPGKAAVGIEIPNKEPQPVLLREILEDDTFTKFPSAIAFGVGKDIAGNPVVTDIARMPHLLIAGATGAGKSVCINTLITSILYKARPDEVKLLMVDPKVVELSMYNGIPHLLVPVVTDPKKASDALQWAVSEMEQRYERFAEVGVRDLKGYNHYAAHVMEDDDEDGDDGLTQTMPQIVIIIDELADLMMTCKGAVEESICRLAQKARAAGIHMILATQRPSVDVITGLIKANIPSRLAFSVSSGTDSRTVLDMIGAEKLLGKGDMLFLPVGQNKPTRLQGGFVSDKEVEAVVEFLKVQTVPTAPPQELEQVTSSEGVIIDDKDLDEFFYEATEFLIEKGKGSTSMLQRQFRIGYNRASRLMEDLEARGIVGPEDGVKPRKVTITWEEYQARYGR